MFQKRKEKRIEQLTEQKLIFEQRNCTFRPQIHNSNSTLPMALHADYNKMNTKAIEKFIERQIDARQRKEINEDLQKTKAGGGFTW